MKTISLLGTGWLGLPVARQLIKLGYQVKGSTTSDHRLDELRHEGIEPFLFNLEEVTQDEQASESLARFLTSDILMINMPGKNIEAFGRLARIVEQSTVKKLMFISSTSVYTQTTGTVTEEDADPTTPLAQIEQCYRALTCVETTVVRMAGLIGGRRHPGRFFKPGREIKAPNAPVNLIHQDDCVAIVCALIEQGIWGETFNAVAPSHSTKAEFYTQSAIQAGLPAPQMADVGGDGKSVDNQKLCSRLTYTFIHPDLMQIKF